MRAVRNGTERKLLRVGRQKVLLQELQEGLQSREQKGWWKLPLKNLTLKNIALRNTRRIIKFTALIHGFPLFGFAIFSFLISLFSAFKPVLAHCPLCTAATGAAVAVARYYGVDDLIVGTFIGGFVISTAFWFNRILRKRNKGEDYLPFQSAIIILLSFILTFVSFHTAGIVSFSTLFGIDRIFAGMSIGSAISLAAFGFNDFIRKSNGNKNYIPFQVIFMTIAFLSLSALGYYIVGVVR